MKDVVSEMYIITTFSSQEIIERINPWRDDAGAVLRYGDREIPGEQMIMCGGNTVSVGGQGRR